MTSILKYLNRALLVLLLAAFAACSDNEGGNESNGNGDDGNTETPADGDTYGYIKDTNGNPVEGVVVSDGYSCTATDAEGRYALTRNADAGFVFYSLPSAYKVSVDKTYKLPRFFARLQAGTARYDFTLEALAAPEKRFDLICIGDPQINEASHAVRFKEEAGREIREYAASAGVPCYGITLGDHVNNKWTLFTNMVVALQPEQTGVPVFATIGNHDHEFPTADEKAARAKYESYFGPVDYSFNRGDVHFIAMDNIIFTGTDYTGGFTDEQVAWLEKDLSFVPTDKMVILYYHIPLRDNTGYLNRKKVLDMISRYKNPTLMCAHTHYFQPYHMRSHKLFERIHGGTCGYFWRSTCGGDGTPNGFMVYEIDGTEIIDTYFKASQRADDYQIRLYRGNAEFAGPYATYKYDVGADVVVANVFTSGMDGTTWKVELSEDGGKTWSVMTEMSQSYGDRWIRGYHIGVEKHPVESGTSPCYHQYQCKLKNPEATGIVVRATDSFNHVYTQTRFNESNDFTEAEGY